MWRVRWTEGATPPEPEREGELPGELERVRGGGKIEREAALMHRVTRWSSREARFSSAVAGVKERLLTMRTRGAGNPRLIAP